MMDTINAMFTIWWFASGEQVMHTSNSKLADKIYYWRFNLQD